MFGRKRRKLKPAKVRYRKFGGLYFFTLIPLSLLIGCVALINLVLLLLYGQSNNTAWAFFFSGFVGASAIVSTMKLRKFRTFIHELKHAIVVVCTGNRLKEFHVEEHTGHVSYDLLVSKAHFAPLIILAPYFYPVLSIPTLIVCLLYEHRFPELLTVLLGGSLAADIIMGYQEIHSNQTDLKKIFGGFLIAAIFIISIQFMWSMLCLLWVSAGNNAYVFSAYNIIDVVMVYLKDFWEAFKALIYS